MAGAAKSVILVHGGFVDGSGWEGVYKILRKDGFAVSIVQNPTISLADDVAVTKRVIAGQTGPVILVGHSYGGAVITEAGNDPKVVGLVYITAFAPDQGESVYVPPMYTKPRPIIPRYRAISGLLSVLIVTLLLCTGAGYYAKASGKLNALGQFAGFAPPTNLKPTSTQILPDAPTAQVTGPAYNIINSATTTANINSQGVATKTDTVFKPNQTIYVTYSVHPLKAPGIVTVKWYTNGAFYQANKPSQLISSPMAGRTQAAYAQSAEGKVELYWNDQLAVSLFFVVR